MKGVNSMDPLVVKERRALWLNRIEQLAQSGMTQKEWCQQQGIPVTTMRYWIRKLRLQPEEACCSETGTWLEFTRSRQTIPTVAVGQTQEPVPTLILRIGQFVLEFYEPISPIQLSRYLKELGYQ